MASLRCLNNYAVLLLVAGVLGGCSPQGGDQAAETQSPFEGVHIFEGQVSDSSCGVMHKIADAKQCTEQCVAAGGSYVLVIGDVVHSLQGNNEEIKQFAGQTVQVSASLDGNTLRVVRIGPPAQPPQEG
jgi:hypothetical protein